MLIDNKWITITTLKSKLLPTNHYLLNAVPIIHLHPGGVEAHVCLGLIAVEEDSHGVGGAHVDTGYLQTTIFPTEDSRGDEDIVIATVLLKLKSEGCEDQLDSWSILDRNTPGLKIQSINLI